LAVQFTTLVSFNFSNGANPYGGLTADANGDLFGTTINGTSSDGTVFEIKNTGTVAAPVYAGGPATLVSFAYGVGPNGASPYGGLIADANGDLFGTTYVGGAINENSGLGYGTVFEIKNTGTVAAPVYASALTTLVNFNGSNGQYPYAGLIADANGDLFGTTYDGGANGYGTAFEIQNTGTTAAPVYASSPTTLVSFSGTNGADPYGALIADANGDLFGTTYLGGANNDGTVFEIKNTGTVAAPVYASAPTPLVSFNGSNGELPHAGLIADANGDLFGTTTEGGNSYGGTVFEIKNTGTVAAPVYASAPTTLVNFDGSNGANPQAALIAANGDLFGTTEAGGANGDGTVFEITGAFVTTTIKGTVAGQTTTMEAPLAPFAGVAVTDPNATATDTLTVTLGGAGGALADGSGFSNLTSEGNGVYSLSGTASAITTELDALVFTPMAAWPNASATTTFTLSDVSIAGGAPAVDSTTTVTDNDPSGAISVSAAYLAANIDGINTASQVSSITLTDPGILQLNLTDAQATGDLDALNKITNEVFEVLAPGMAPTYYVGGNGATGPSISLATSNGAAVERANSRVTLTGSNDMVTVASGSNLTVSGSNDAIAATTGDGITVKSGTGETITGSGFTVHAAIGTAFTVGGNGLSGTLDHVNCAGASVTVQANSNVALTGSNDSVSMGAGSNLTVSGFTDAIRGTTGDRITIKAGTGETVSGSGFTVHGGSGAGFTIVGTGDVVYGGLNDAISDGGSSTNFKINSNVGNLAISGFGADPTGIINLLNGVGGYATASQAFSALTSDHSGGSMLSLGTDGSIDFVNVAPSSLHASNFKIG